MIQLDVLRGVAILLVLFHHRVVQSGDAGALEPMARFLANGGWTGVDLFFVLSGFLIGGLLLAEVRARGRIDVWRFAVRRILKIWPGYYLVVLAAIAIDGPGHWSLALRIYLPYFFHLQNYSPYNTRIFHTWSLAVEEHFYIALPLLIWLLIRVAGSVRALPWIALAIVLVCNVLRAILLPNRPFRMWTHYTPTHLRADSLAFGVLLAYLYHFRFDALQRVGKHQWTLLFVGLTLERIADQCTRFWKTGLGLCLIFQAFLRLTGVFLCTLICNPL